MLAGMKTLRLFLCALASCLMVTALSAQSPSAPKGKTAPKQEQKKEEEMGKIEGMEIARANGHFLGLTVEGGQWKLTFYNTKKKPEPVDVTRGAARWVIPMKADNERTVLNPGPDGHSLVGSRFVRPPYHFKIFITLIRGEGDAAEAGETYTVDYRG